MPLSAPSVQQAILSHLPLARDFRAALEQHGQWPLRTRTLETLQINVGKLCNQTCGHCHVDAGPDRREIMTRESAEICIRALRNTEIRAVDITGVAPELNPTSRMLVAQTRSLGRHLMHRRNPSVL